MLLIASTPFYFYYYRPDSAICYLLSEALEAYKLVDLPLAPITSVHNVLLYFFVAYKINVKNPPLVCKAFHSMALVYLFHLLCTISPPTTTS